MAKLIEAAEDLMQSAYSESVEEPGDLNFCLEVIEARSLGLKFSASQMAIVMGLWAGITTSIREGRTNQLPLKAQAALGEVRSFLKRRNCIVEFRDSAHAEVMASMSGDTPIPEMRIVHTKTSLIGQVVRVGGNSPKVLLRLMNGQKLSCSTSEGIAKDLGHRLYDFVTCRGEASWNLAATELLKFRIDEVGTFRKSSVSEAFAALAAQMPKTLSRWREEGRTTLTLDETE